MIGDHGHASHDFAAALGVSRGAGCECALCGLSPFGAAGPTKRVLGVNFTGWSLLKGGSGSICTACARCFAGKPSKTDPPLRMGSVVLTAECKLHRALKPRDLWPWLVGDLPTPRRISHSASWKRHHWIHSGPCSDHLLVVGGDDGPIRIAASEREVLVLVAGALSVFRRKEIVSGHYHPRGVESYGPTKWAAMESRLRLHRGTGLLALAAACAPKGHARREEEEEEMIPESDKTAASLLAMLCYGSSMRVRDGKAFWGGVLQHRVARFARLPLHDMVARLMAELDVTPTSPTTSGALSLLAGVGQAQAAVEKSIRTRHRLVCALAYTEMKQLRAAINESKEEKKK